MPPGADNEDLLLRIQSDVAQGVAGLTQTADQLANLLNVAADTNKVLRDMNQASSDAGTGFTQTQAKVVTLAGAVSLLKEGFALAGRALREVKAATFDGAAAFGGYTQALDNATKQVGVSARFYQELQTRLQLLGLSADSAQQSLIFFNRALESARQGAGPLSQVFQELRVNIDRTRDAEDVYRDVAVALDGVTDSSRKVRLETELFSRSGALQAPVLHAIAEGGKGAADELERLGIILDKDAVAAGLRFNDALDELEVNTQAFHRQLNAAKAEALEPFIRALADGMGEVTPLVKEHREALAELAKVMTVVAASVIGVATWRGIAVAMDFAVGVIQGMTAAFAELSVAEAIATGGLILLPGLLAGAATATVLWSDKLETLLSKIRQLEQTKLPGWAQTLINAIADPRAALQQFIENVAFGDLTKGSATRAPGAMGDAMSAHALAATVATAKAWEFTPEQLSKITKSNETLQTALDQAAVEAIERSQGRAAAIAAQRDRDVAAIQRKFDQERVDRARQLGVNALDPSGPDATEILQRQNVEMQAAREQAGAQLKALAFQQGQALSEQDIAQAKALQGTLIEIERAKNTALFQARQIGTEEYLGNERLYLDQLYQLDKDAAEKRLTLQGVANDPVKLADAKAQLLAVEQQYQRDVADLDNRGLELRKRAADEQRDILSGIAQLEAQAFGTQQQQQLAALAKAHEDMVRRLKEAGLEQYIQRVDDAYAAMADRIKFGSVDIGAAIESSLADSFKGIVSGTRDLKSAVSGLGQGLLGAFTEWMTKSLEAKLGFDKTLEGNFFETIPGFAREGAEKVGQIWSNLWDFLSGGTGVGERVTVNETAATGGTKPNSQSSESSGSNTADTLSGLSKATKPDTKPGYKTKVVGRDAQGNYVVENELGQRYSGPDQAKTEEAASGTGSAASAAGGVSSALGIIGAVIAVAQLVGEVVDGFRKGFKAASQEAYKRGASASDVSSAAFSHDIAGGIWAKILGEKIGGQINYSALTGGLGPILDAAGIGIFQPKTTGTIVKKELAKAASDARLPQQQQIEIGGRTGLRTGSIEQSPNQAAYDAFAALGFDQTGIIANANLSRPINAAAATNPGTESLRTGAALALGGIFGQSPREAANVANALTSNFELLGLSAKEARREMLQLAQASGVTLVNALNEYNKQLLEGDITQQQFNAYVDGAIDLFGDALPKAINIAALRLDSMSSSGITDIQKLTDELRIAATVIQGMDFGGAVAAALQSGRSGSFRSALESSFGQTVTSVVSNAIGQSDALQAIFKTPTTALTLAAQAFTEGDVTKANAQLQIAGDSMAAAYAKGTAFIDQLLKASPALRQMVEDAKNLQAATDLLGNALGNALNPLLDPNTGAEEQARRARIEGLEVAIDRAKIFGDEIRASELEMELATERAAQSVAGNAGAGQAFLQSLKQGVKKQIVEGVIQGLVESDAVKAAIVPFLAVANEAVTGLINDPSSAALQAARIDTAWQQVVPALTAITKVIDQIGPLLAGIQGYASGGVIPGPLGLPQMAIVHGGERVLTPSQQHGYGNQTIVIHTTVSGNTVMGADMDDFAMKVGEATFRTLKQNLPLGHRR